VLNAKLIGLGHDIVMLSLGCDTIKHVSLLTHRLIVWGQRSSFGCCQIAYGGFLFLPKICSAVLEIVILSVRPSVRPSHAYFVTKRKNILPIF